MQIKRHLVSTDIEKKILTGLIVSDNYYKQVQKMLKKQYFKVSYIQTIYDWISEYYNIYKENPGKEIQTIYNVEKENVKEADASIIGQFLNNLSNDYEQSTFNVDYLVDQTKIYFRERSLYLLTEEIQAKLARGRLADAEQTIKGYNKVAQQTSSWFNPFDQKNIQDIYENDTDKLFRLPGELGEMSGYFERDWLIAFMGPMKRGKSWWIQELAIHALMSNLKVAFFSLEMNKKAVSKRVHKRIAVLANSQGTHNFSIFDCERNQDNTCERSERTCTIGIKDPGGPRPEFKKVKGYRPCTICKSLDQNKKTDYVRATWFNIHQQKENIGTKNVSKKIKTFLTQYGNNLRIMAYPAFSASFDDIESDLDNLEYQENFIPDVVCVDYFDITNPGKNTGNLSERGKADHIWKRGKGCTTKFHQLWATVLQSNRPSISKKSLEQEDTSEDIRKLAHVDMLFGLNQTKEEKEENLMRLSVIAHRHEEFSFKGEVAVLQSLALGQPLLFSGWHQEKGK